MIRFPPFCYRTSGAKKKRSKTVTRGGGFRFHLLSFRKRTFSRKNSKSWRSAALTSDRATPVSGRTSSRNTLYTLEGFVLYGMSPPESHLSRTSGPVLFIKHHIRGRGEIAGEADNNKRGRCRGPISAREHVKNPSEFINGFGCPKSR